MSKEISTIPLGTIRFRECSKCGEMHEFLSSYGEQRIIYRAIDHCPNIDKRKEESDGTNW